MCKDKHRHCHAKKEQRTYGYNDLHFRPMFPNGESASIEFPNGFVMRAQFNKDGRLDFITIRDGLNEYTKDVKDSDFLPSLAAWYHNLHKKADIMYVCDVMRAIQELDESDLKKFREE